MSNPMTKALVACLMAATFCSVTDAQDNNKKKMVNAEEVSTTAAATTVTAEKIEQCVARGYIPDGMVPPDSIACVKFRKNKDGTESVDENIYLVCGLRDRIRAWRGADRNCGFQQQGCSSGNCSGTYQVTGSYNCSTGNCPPTTGIAMAPQGMDLPPEAVFVDGNDRNSYMVPINTESYRGGASVNVRGTGDSRYVYVQNPVTGDELRFKENWIDRNIREPRTARHLRYNGKFPPTLYDMGKDALAGYVAVQTSGATLIAARAQRTLANAQQQIANQGPPVTTFNNNVTATSSSTSRATGGSASVNNQFNPVYNPSVRVNNTNNNTNNVRNYNHLQQWQSQTQVPPASPPGQPYCPTPGGYNNGHPGGGH